MPSVVHRYRGVRVCVPLLNPLTDHLRVENCRLCEQTGACWQRASTQRAPHCWMRVSSCLHLLVSTCRLQGTAGMSWRSGPGADIRPRCCLNQNALRWVFVPNRLVVDCVSVSVQLQLHARPTQMGSLNCTQTQLWSRCALLTQVAV